MVRLSQNVLPVYLQILMRDWTNLFESKWLLSLGWSQVWQRIDKHNNN